MENSRPERQIERAHIRFTKATHLRRCFFIFIVHNCFFLYKKASRHSILVFLFASFVLFLILLLFFVFVVVVVGF